MAPDLRPLLPLLCAALLAAADNANVEPGDPGPELPEGMPFATVIALRNPHDRAVRVVQLDATCTCSRLEMRDRFLLPHAAGALEVVVDHRNRSGPQELRVTAFLSDPDLEPIEAHLRWRVRAAVQVDGIASLADPRERPSDRAWQDVYKYVAHERPDEPHRLRKRIRLSCPPGEVPPGGLRLDGIDYPGAVWRFAAEDQGNGSILVTATARDPQARLPEGTFDERVVLRTNHPAKPRIELIMVAIIDREAGRRAVDPLLPDLDGE